MTQAYLKPRKENYALPGMWLNYKNLLFTILYIKVSIFYNDSTERSPIHRPLPYLPPSFTFPPPVYLLIFNSIRQLRSSNQGRSDNHMIHFHSDKCFQLFDVSLRLLEGEYERKEKGRSLKSRVPHSMRLLSVAWVCQIHSYDRSNNLILLLYIYIYIQTHTHTHTHIYIYIYIYIEEG